MLPSKKSSGSILKNRRRCIMADAILQFLLGIAVGCGIWAYIVVIINGKRLNKLEKKVNELDNTIKELKI
jgi:hypothetical protein